MREATETDWTAEMTIGNEPTDEPTYLLGPKPPGSPLEHPDLLLLWAISRQAPFAPFSSTRRSPNPRVYWRTPAGWMNEPADLRRLFADCIVMLRNFPELYVLDLRLAGEIDALIERLELAIVETTK